MIEPTDLEREPDGPQYCDGSGVVGYRAVCCMTPDPSRPDVCCGSPDREDIPCTGCVACMRPHT